MEVIRTDVSIQYMKISRNSQHQGLFLRASKIRQYLTQLFVHFESQHRDSVERAVQMSLNTAGKHSSFSITEIV